jgi:hypothetical protein
MVRRRHHRAFPRGTWGWLFHVRTRPEVKPRLRNRTDFGVRLREAFFENLGREFEELARRLVADPKLQEAVAKLS